MCSINHCGTNEWLKRPVSKSNCWLQANAVCSTHLCGTIFPLYPPLLSIRKPLFCETSLHTSWLFVRMILWVLTLPSIFTAFLSMLIFQTSFSFCLMLGCVPPCYLHSRHIPYEKSDSADNSLRSLANYVTQYPATSPDGQVEEDKGADYFDSEGFLLALVFDSTFCSLTKETP